MNTRKLRKAIMTLCAALLLVSLSVGITIAYLTDDDAVTNTFTVGKIDIWMDEAVVNEYGATPDENGKFPGEDGFDSTKLPPRVRENEYKLIPGHTYTKDPIIWVDGDSEDCWLFVKLENALADIEADNGETIVDQMTKTYDWIALDEENGIYYHEFVRDAGSVVPVFDHFTIAGDADISGYATADNADSFIKVTAYAVQADGFYENPRGAWEATFGAPQQPAPEEPENGETV